MSLVPLAPGDDKPDNAAFPAGRRDANTDLGQQLDLRQTNSWTLKLEEVSTAEMAEVRPTAYRLLLPTAYYYYSPLATRHSPLTTHHSPLTTHHSPLTTHYCFSPGARNQLSRPRHPQRPPPSLHRGEWPATGAVGRRAATA